MSLMTGTEYRRSLVERRPLTVYLGGERLERPFDHPIIRASVNSIALTYELAEDPKYRETMTAVSALTGKKINRFCHLHQSPEDLYKKVGMQRLLGQKCGTCFQRCVGMDAFNAVYSTTFEMDEKHGTNYHARFVEYMKLVEDRDLVVDGCMTDAKTDRGKRPHELTDPDGYVRVVERRPDGIVVSGAKMHQTGAINSHHAMVMPTMAMDAQDKEYAICFAVESDAPGIVYIYGRQSCDTRLLEDSDGANMDAGSPGFGGQECMVIFNNVFVPNAWIFMNGEWDFTGMLVERFSGYHRQSYACKTGVGDVAIGAAALIAQYNGVDRASHIKDKIVEMIHLNETIWSSSVACSWLGTKTRAGNYLIDMLLANVCKQNVTRFPYEIARLLQDIAGGIMVTMPSAGDMNNPDTRPYLEKYLKGVDGVSALDRMKLLRLIENLTMGRAAVGYLTESMHGAGSPQAQRIMISRQSDVEKKKAYAKNLARIED